MHPETRTSAAANRIDVSRRAPTDLEELEPGSLLGSYRVLSLLREGGMGRVYIAEHTLLGRQVALKVLRPEYSANRHAVTRFFAEARAVNRISHENIVEITDFCENGDGHNYLIMELLRGQDLGDLLLKVGVIPVHRAIDIAIQVAGALTVVHAGRIIHRDLKPDNIYLVDRPSRLGFVKLLDFGVAKLIDPDGAGIQLGTTAEGAIVGTPEYMSPEQATGDVIDHRSDIYSLGVILYEMVTGVLPFRAANFGELVVQLLTARPEPLSAYTAGAEVPVELEQLIFEMLEKKPADRPQTMHEIEQRLRAMQDDLMPLLGATISTRARRGTDRAATLAVATHEPEPAPAPAKRRHSKKLLGVAAVTVLAAVASAGWYAMPEPAPTPERVAPPPIVTTPTRAPAPPAPPAVPARVVIHFHSTPSGARVRQVGSESVLGTTPFAYELDRADEVRSFRFDRAGYLPATQAITVASDGDAAVSLTHVPAPRVPAAPAAPAGPAASHHVDRNSTMKVFE